MRQFLRSHWAAVGSIAMAVVLVAVGGVVGVKALQSSGGFSSSGQAPQSGEDWTHGVVKAWQVGGVRRVLLQSEQAWVVLTNASQMEALNPETGSTMWTADLGAYASVSCADTTWKGQAACVESGSYGASQSVCLIDLQTGGTNCIAMDDAVPTAQSQSLDWWSIWFTDGALIVRGVITPNDYSTDYDYLYLNVMARLSLAPLRIDWARSYDECNSWGSGSNALIGPGQEGLTGNVYWTTGPDDEGPAPFAVDIRTGEQVLPQARQGQCDVIAPLNADTFVADTDVPSGSVSLPGGGRVNIVSNDDFGAISYFGSAMPTTPLYYQITGDYYEPTTGAIQALGANWQVPLRPQVVLAGAGGSFINGVVSGHTLIAVGRDGQVKAIDYKSGAVLWTASAPVSDPIYPLPMAAAVVGNVVVVGGIGMSSNGAYEHSQVTLLNLATGTPIWQTDGEPAIPPSSDMLGILSGDDDNNVLARYIPGNQPSTQMPSDMPPCPAGMTAVAWTRYADGSVLVCSGNGTYSVVQSAGWRAADLQWVDDGYIVTFSNGAIIQADLGGSLVTVTRRGAQTVYVAGDSWMVSSGASMFTQTPSDIPSCPAGTWPIALSTWQGGWLLVCGTDASDPTSLYYSDGSNTGQSSSVSITGGGYCGQLDNGQACTYAVPALVTIGDTQHSVSNNYFTGQGAGGSGQGTGAYGVPAPGDTAAQQVQYLLDILERSSATLKQLGPPSTDVRNCRNLDDAIWQIQEVAQGRQDQLSALDSTPVDKIDIGAQLVSELRAALQASYIADESWIDWGQSQQAYGCSAEPQSVLDTNHAAGVAKDTFYSTWNAQIAPVYGVRTFKSGDI